MSNNAINDSKRRLGVPAWDYGLLILWHVDKVEECFVVEKFFLICSVEVGRGGVLWVFVVLNTFVSVCITFIMSFKRQSAL